MINFEKEKANSINLFFFDDINNEYQKFEQKILSLLNTEKDSIIDDYKPLSHKNIKNYDDNVLNSFISIVQEVKNLKSKTSSIKIHCVSDLKNENSIQRDVISNEFKKVLLSNKNREINKISLEDATRIFPYLLQIDTINFNNNINLKSTNKVQLIFEAMILNIHTHTSKIVNSSSSLNITSLREDITTKNLGLNSKTLSAGLDITYSTGGGVYQKAKELIQALTVKYFVDSNDYGTCEEISLLKIIKDILFKLTKGYSLNIIENIIYNELNSLLDKNEDLLTLYNNATAKSKNNLMGCAQIIYSKNNRAIFENLIPLPSNKVLDSIKLISDQIENFANEEKTKNALVSDKLLKKENEVILERKIKLLANRFYKIKSVASNAQNISDFASTQGANFIRFNSIPYIKVKKEYNERIFFFIHSIMSKDNIKNIDLSDFAYSKMIDNIDAKLKLSNKVLDNLYKPFLDNLSKKLIAKLNLYKKKIEKIEDKYEMNRKISKQLVQSTIQKYLLSIPLSENEISELVSFLITLYEFNTHLSQIEKNYLAKQIKEQLCI